MADPVTRYRPWQVLLPLTLVLLFTAAAGAQERDPAAADEYRVGANDVLRVSMFGSEELDGIETRVEQDGSVSLPLVGKVRVAGLTLEEAEAALEASLVEKELVREPEVTIFVQEYVSRSVYVQGAVREPGTYQLLGARTLLDILGQAGGVSGRESEQASDRILVVRRHPDGEQETLEIDANRLIHQGDVSLNIPLQPGDNVIVPFEETFQVWVTGAVERPGPVEAVASQGITVLQAINAAGGPTERAALGKVHIIRRAEDGSESRIKVNVKKIRKGRTPDVPLERGDTVVVAEWFF